MLVSCFVLLIYEHAFLGSLAFLCKTEHKPLGIDYFHPTKQRQHINVGTFSIL